jgi:hypothetical protein
MLRCLAILIALYLLAATEVRAEVAKLKVPDEPSQAKAEGQIRQIFKGEYASNEPAARRGLAKKLLESAQDAKTEATARFVLFREARNVAAGAGHAVGALRAVDEMNRVFAIDPAAYKAVIIQTAGRSIANQEDAAVYVSAGISLVDQMMGAHDFAGAGKLLPPTMMVAGQMKNGGIIRGVRNKGQYVKDTQVEFERLRGVMGRAGGELAGGKFACFFEDDWGRGLARLANSGDAKLKEAASKDLDGPKTGAERMAAGNAWWEVAQRQTGIAKAKFEARARHWYRQAMADVGGLERVQLERRIASSLGAPEDATMFGDHAYSASSATTGWNEAKLMCELAGGHLVYIESMEEWNFMMKLATGPRYWIGATDQEEQGNWRWLNGGALEFKAWGRGQPDNHAGVQHWAYAASGTWDDTGREDRCGMICEWE